MTDEITNEMKIRAVQRVMAHEGRYDSLNLNSDGQGLSFGILQWSQKSGALGELLDEMVISGQTAIVSAMGSRERLDAVMEAASQPTLTKALSRDLWTSPWKEVFRAIGQTPSLQAIQDKVATNGVYMAAAIRSCRTLGDKSLRALCFCLDRAVQQGPGGLARITQPGMDLEDLATACRDHFVRLFPFKNYRQVGDQYHLFQGEIDIPLDVWRRCRSILDDPSLC